MSTSIVGLARVPEQLDVFSVGVDGRMTSAWWHDSTPWSGTFTIGGFFPPGAPVAAVARSQDHLDVFVIGNDGRMYTSWWHNGQNWSGTADNWLPIGGFFPVRAHVAAVARMTEHLDVFVVGKDGRMYTSWWHKGQNWSGINDNWLNLGGAFPPGAPIAVVARMPGHLDVFAVGNDGRMYVAWWHEGGNWSQFIPIGGFFPPGAPVAAVARSQDHLDAFVIGNDGRMYTSWWHNGQNWSGTADNWLPIGGFFPVRAHVAAVARMTEHLDVFVVGKDGRMYTSWWHKGQDWSGRNDNWLAIGGFFPPGAPTSAVGRLQNHLDVFVVGNDDQMYTSWWHEGQDWSGRNDNWHSLLHRDKVPFELERAKILEKYNQLGGRISSLGLPADAQMPVFNTGTSFRMNFRGGHIDLPAGSDKPVAVKRFRAEIWWMGIECQIRQEGTDEIYGGIGVLVPGSGLSKTEKFSDDTDGTWDMGPDGMRIINTARLLYNGPPMDIVLTVSLIEHDSGDQSEVKNKIADAIAKAAQSMAVLAGIPAEATSATQGWVNDLSLGLVSAVGNALGVNDDRYPPQQLRIRWPEIQGRQFVRKTARRNDDPRTIEYTHVITVTGFDEARDRGQYALYFDVRLFEDQEVLP